NFSAICSEYDDNGVCKPGKGAQLYNPFQRDAAGNRLPFAKNLIPINLIDPVAKALFSSGLYPAPINGDPVSNQRNTSRNFTHGHQGHAKLDSKRLQKESFFGGYSQSRQDNGGTNSFPLLFDTFFRAPAYTGVANWTRTFSPRLVNEARLGVNYTLVNNGG